MAADYAMDSMSTNGIFKARHRRNTRMKFARDDETGAKGDAIVCTSRLQECLFE